MADFSPTKKCFSVFLSTSKSPIFNYSFTLSEKKISKRPWEKEHNWRLREKWQRRILCPFLRLRQLGEQFVLQSFLYAPLPQLIIVTEVFFQTRLTVCPSVCPSVRRCVRYASLKIAVFGPTRPRRCLVSNRTMFCKLSVYPCISPYICQPKCHVH